MFDSALHTAAKENDLKKVEFLLSKGAKVDLKDNCGKTPLHEAAMKNWNSSHLEVIQLLLQNGADVNSRDHHGKQPLHYFKRASVQTVKVLLGFGADIEGEDKYGETPLFYAVRARDLGVVKFLVSKGANPNVKSNDDSTLLHEAYDNHDEYFSFSLQCCHLSSGPCC